MENKANWSDLLESAVNQPGMIEEGFRLFHNYSLGNQLLAMAQCHDRGITPGPIATYPKWKELKRQVQKGQKAITLCMPVTFKAKTETEPEEGSDTPAAVRTGFVYKNNWFVLSQTEGEEYNPPAPPDWDRKRALESLAVDEIPFDLTNGNVQGFARKNGLAINPVAQNPAATMFHELGHIVLGHTSQGDAMQDGEQLDRSEKEMEAEAVALLCLESLGMNGAEFCRGYIQNWGKGKKYSETNARRIFSAADKILKAGREAEANGKAVN